MPPALRITVLSSVLLFPATLAAQELQLKDSRAVSILQTSFAAMGGQNLSLIRDTVATVQFTTARLEKESPGQATIKTLGTKLWETEADSSGTKSLLTVNLTQAYSKEGAAESKRIPRLAVASAGITHIPVLSILSEWADPTVKVEHLGERAVGDAKYTVIRMQRPLPEGTGLGDFDAPCDLYIHPDTLLVAKLVYHIRAPQNLLQTVPIEVTYEDYRFISGIAVPFRVTYSLRGQTLSQYQVTSFGVNQGARESDFNVR